MTNKHEFVDSDIYAIFDEFTKSITESGFPATFPATTWAMAVEIHKLRSSIDELITAINNLIEDCDKERTRHLL